MLQRRAGEVAHSTAGGNVTNTKTIPVSSQAPGFAMIPGTPNKVYGFILLAALVGLVYWLGAQSARAADSRRCRRPHAREVR